tara:strand:- start:966 stop:3584 length:2619 start_codon:yes stop_codon:yes gene_type:complete
MVQTKRNFKKKNKKTRKKKGGQKPEKDGTALFNKHYSRNVPTQEQKCIKSMKKDSKYNIKIPIWIDRLRRQLPRDQQRQWQKAIKDLRWDERHHWCKKKGYCKKGKAWIKANTTKNKKRCINPPNKGGYCEVDLNLLEWHHCVKSCGRHKKVDNDKLKKAKDDEAVIKCNDVRVKIGDKYFSMQNAAKGLVEHNAKIKKELAEKRAKELAEKKKREAKARKEAEAAIARAKKLMEEKKAKEAERKRKLKEAEEKRKEKLRKEKEEKKRIAEEKKRIEEEHKRKVAEAKAAKEKERLEKLKREKEAREEKERKRKEAERKRKEKEAKEEADRIQKLKEKREKEAKAKTKCIADMLNDFEDESKKIIESVLNGHKNVSDWVEDSNDVEEALKKMGKINDAQRKVSKKYNDCFKKINANLPGGPRNELNAKLKKIQDKLMTYFEQINAVEERIEKEEAEEYKVQSPQNLKFSGQVTDSYDFKLAPKKCKEKRACDNQLKNKIQGKKGLRNKPEFCIGSVIEGQDLYGSRMSLDYYTGVVIGNAIEKGLPAKYQPGYPALYYSNYNYGSFPFYSILVKVNKPTKTKIDNFKRWYYKMAKRHGDKPGEYPINTLKAMTRGVLTTKVKDHSGKSHSQRSSSKPQPQKIPVQFIKYLPCIPKGQSGGRKKKTRKRSKRGGGPPAKAGKSICVWYGKNNDSRAKDKCPDNLSKLGPDHELYGQIHPIGYKLIYTFLVPTGVKIWSIGSEFVNKIHDIFNHENIKPVNSDMISGNYDFYYILYEYQCAYGGERFELMKLTNATVVNNNKKLMVTSKTPKWNDTMEMTQKNKNLHIKWGSKKEVLPVGSLWAVPTIRHSIGGRKKRTRRRKKRRRKRTKKRR